MSTRLCKYISFSFFQDLLASIRFLNQWIFFPDAELCTLSGWPIIKQSEHINANWNLFICKRSLEKLKLENLDNKFFLQWRTVIDIIGNHESFELIDAKYLLSLIQRKIGSIVNYWIFIVRRKICENLFFKFYSWSNEKSLELAFFRIHISLLPKIVFYPFCIFQVLAKNRLILFNLQATL